MCKTFCLYFHHAYLFFCTNQQNVLQKVIKDWTLEVYLLTGEPSSWLLLIESLKMTCARSFAWSNGVGLDCFSWPSVLLKVSKIIVNYPKLVKVYYKGQFWFVKRQQNYYQFLTAVSNITSLRITSHGEARNIKFGQQVNIIHWFHWVLCHRRQWCHYLIITWLLQICLSLVTEEVLLSNLGSKNNFLKEVVHFSISGSNVNTFWSCDIDKSLYLQL